VKFVKKIIQKKGNKGQTAEIRVVKGGNMAKMYKIWRDMAQMWETYGTVLGNLRHTFIDPGNLRPQNVCAFNKWIGYT
jgi:hypothetical protein